MASLLQSVATLDPAVMTGAQTFVMGTRDGAAVTGLAVGELAPGNRADFVAINPDDLSLQPGADLLTNVVYSMETEAIRRVYVEGRPVMVDRQIVGVPEQEIRTRLSDLTRWLDALA